MTGPRAALLDKCARIGDIFSPASGATPCDRPRARRVTDTVEAPKEP